MNNLLSFWSNFSSFAAPLVIGVGGVFLSFLIFVNIEKLKNDKNIQKKYISLSLAIVGIAVSIYYSKWIGIILFWIGALFAFTNGGDQNGLE